MSKDAPEHVSTRIISQRELIVDGAPFEWWAVGELAASLAKELLAQHYARAGRSPTGKKLPSEPASGLNKPGWFEPGDAVDFSTTVF